MRSNWIDPRAVGRPIQHDGRQAYNPPMVIAPAMDDAQFAYDNQREVEASLITNPVVMAHMIVDLKHRVEALEKELDDDYRTPSTR